MTRVRVYRLVIELSSCYKGLTFHYFPTVRPPMFALRGDDTSDTGRINRSGIYRTVRILLNLIKHLPNSAEERSLSGGGPSSHVVDFEHMRGFVARRVSLARPTLSVCRQTAPRDKAPW